MCTKKVNHVPRFNAKWNFTFQGGDFFLPRPPISITFNVGAVHCKTTSRSCLEAFREKHVQDLKSCDGLTFYLDDLEPHDLVQLPVAEGLPKVKVSLVVLEQVQQVGRVPPRREAERKMTV